MQRSVVLTVGLVVSVVLLSGCGASTTTVSGKVTYQGKTVVWGNVSVVASDNISYAGEIKEDGTFTIPKVPVGPCKIGVTSPDPEAKDPAPSPFGKDMGISAKVGKPIDRPKPPPGTWFEIPDNYRDPVNSGVTREIKKGVPLNVDLQ